MRTQHPAPRNTTIRVYTDEGHWSDPMTVEDYLNVHLDYQGIRKVYITEACTRIEANRLLKKFIEKRASRKSFKKYTS